jgi:hypothetical protein
LSRKGVLEVGIGADDCTCKKHGQNKRSTVVVVLGSLFRAQIPKPCVLYAIGWDMNQRNYWVKISNVGFQECITCCSVWQVTDIILILLSTVGETAI